MAGVQARSGFHCAAGVHEYLGTDAGGTVRLGFGPFNPANAMASAILQGLDPEKVATVRASVAKVNAQFQQAIAQQQAGKL